MTRVDFRIVKNEHVPSDEEVNKILENAGFGDYITDHMTHIHYTANPGVGAHDVVTSKNGVWAGHELLGFGPINLTPAALGLHYGQEVFEGMKAYKRADGTVWTFRPELNAKRISDSARRVGLPDISVDDFMDAVDLLIETDKRWIPTGPNESLYIRPVIFASENSIGLRSAREVEFYVIATPFSSYIKADKPVSIWVERDFFRAGPGGTGAAKCGGNYAASLLPQALADEQGFSQVLYLDARDQESVEELGGMSFFAVYKDGTVKTPRLNGQILDSITRRSAIEVLRDRGVNVEETTITITSLIEDIKSGEVVESFACGTAAVVFPIGRLASKDFDVTIQNSEGEGALTKSVREEIVGIQTGKLPDRFNWCHQVC